MSNALSVPDQPLSMFARLNGVGPFEFPPGRLGRAFCPASAPASVWCGDRPYSGIGVTRSMTWKTFVTSRPCDRFFVVTGKGNKERMVPLSRPSKPCASALLMKLVTTWPSGPGAGSSTPRPSSTRST